MPAGVDSHEGEVAATFNLADLRARGELPAVVGREREVVERHLPESLLPGPLERLGPRVVAEPVADEVRVALCGGLVEVYQRVGGGKKGREGREKELTAYTRTGICSKIPGTSLWNGCIQSPAKRKFLLTSKLQESYPSVSAPRASITCGWLRYLVIQLSCL